MRTPTGVRTRRQAPVVVLCAGLLAAFVMWLLLARRLWFFGDDWEFLLNRGTVPGTGLGPLDPHNEHWSTIPILIFRALFAVFGLQHYLPYIVPVLVAHVAVCALTFILIRRAGVRPWVAVAAGLVMAFLGAGAENTTWAFQIGFVGSTTFGLLALLLESTLPPGRRSTGLVWGALLLGLMCSGVGLAMVGLVTLHTWIRAGWRRAAVLASVPAVVYVVWFLGWGRSALPAQRSSLGLYLKLPEYIWTGLASAWDKNVGMPGCGPVVVIGLILACALVGPPKARTLAIAGLVGAVAQLGLSGVSRISFGVDQAASSRYAYLVTVFTLPAAAVAADWVLRRAAWPRPAVFGVAVGVTLMVLVNGIQGSVEFTNGRAAQIGDLRERLMAAIALQQRGEQLLSEVPAPIYNPDIDLTRLEAVADRLPREEASAGALLTVRSSLQVAVSSHNLGLTLAPSPVPLTGLTPSSATAGCGTFASGSGEEGLRLDPAGQARQVTVKGDESRIRTRLVDGSSASAWTDWTTVPGQTYTVGTTTTQFTVEVAFDVAEPTTICAGGPG